MKYLRIEQLKKISLAALLIASATMFTACSSDDSIIGEQPAQQVYTMTIQVTKDDGTTRGLYFTNGTSGILKVLWHKNEAVQVVQNGDVIGTLYSEISDFGVTTLTGEVTGIDRSKGLKLLLHADNNATMAYTGQKGKLLELNDAENSIEDKFDFATAELTKDDYTVSGTTISTNQTVRFTSLQAIVKFKLYKNDGADEVFANKLTISDNNTGKIVQSVNGKTGAKTYGSLTLTSSSGSSYIYNVSLNTDGATDIVLEAEDRNGNIFTYTKSGVTFTAGQYYEVQVNMHQANSSSGEVGRGDDYGTAIEDEWP